MGKLFGTDGIRGVVNAGLDADLAYKVGLAAAEVLAKGKQPGEKPLVTIGKDTRISGDLLKGSLIAGLCTAGADVLDLGTLPTPGVAWVTVDEGVLADGDQGLLPRLLVLGQHLRGSQAHLICQIRVQTGVDHAADAVGPK